MDHLMKGLLLSSGNDAAVAIAEHVAGSVENFCDMMNKKAKEIGANFTNFTSPHGLDNENHYTTAQDLLIFTEYLLDVEYLANIVKLSTTTIKIGSNYKTIRTTNEMLSIYPDVTGVKTGFTNNAGRCLITSLKRNEREIIVILLGADTKRQRTEETIKLIDYGLENFEKINLYEKMKKEFVINIEKSKDRRYEIILSGELWDVLEKGEKDKLYYKYELEKNLIAPVSEGDLLGRIVICKGNQILHTVSLSCGQVIERKNVREYIYEIIKDKMNYIELKP